MKIGLVILIIFCSVSSVFGGDATGFAWNRTISAGYDSYTQTYPLADTDTTETISENEFKITLLGKTKGRQKHNLRVKPVFSVGTETYRAELEAGWRFKPDSTKTVSRVHCRWIGTKYREDSSYNLSSDYSNFELKGYQKLVKDFQLRGNYRKADYANPSVLEQSYADFDAGLYVQKGDILESMKRVGVIVGGRSYPDSSEVNRTTLGWETVYDNGALFGSSVRFYSRGERRWINNPDIKPSSWNSWNSFETALLVDQYKVCFELNNDIWIYDEESSIWSNQFRTGADLFLKNSRFEGPQLRAGIASEFLVTSEQSQESYKQSGVKVGIDYFGEKLTVSGSLEVGRRVYEVIDYYSDFNYYEIWMMSTLYLSKNLSLDVMTNYIPENHSNEIDNQSLGFGSFQLVYRF